ncbi:hypothetical protein [Halarchaeum sp. P4]|uniref:hypothetical protein n=1 Tax=Halarchaeum sp. P4 TaxID=3421639 RepID=UPI003EBC2C3E
MSTDADGLRDIFVSVAGDEEIVEEQEEEINHGAEERDENIDVARAVDDGLNEAIEGQEAGGGASFE